MTAEALDAGTVSTLRAVGRPAERLKQTRDRYSTGRGARSLLTYSTARQRRYGNHMNETRHRQHRLRTRLAFCLNRVIAVPQKLDRKTGFELRLSNIARFAKLRKE